MRCTRFAAVLNCPEVANPNQGDSDDNGLGAACDDGERRDLRNRLERAENSEFMGTMASRRQFPNRFEMPLNFQRELACPPEYCGGGDGRLVPEGYKRVTTVTGPDTFKLVLTDKTGTPVQTKIAECGNSGGCSATLEWRPLTGARVPTDLIEDPVVDLIKTESYQFRVIPMATETYTPHSVMYEVQRGMESIGE